MSPEKLVQEARKQGISSLALTDINTSMGIPDFIKLCHEQHIKAITGIEFREKDQHLFTGIARNNEGFRELNEYLSRRNITGTPFSPEAPAFNQAYTVYPMDNLPDRKLKDHELLGVRPADLRNFHLAGLGIPREKMIAFPAVTFQDQKGYELHRHLRAIDHNILLSRLEPGHLACKDETLLSPDKLAEKYHLLDRKSVV